MDIIQRTVDLFAKLRNRIKQIGAMLAYNYLPSTDDTEKGFGLFWIFNW